MMRWQFVLGAGISSRLIAWYGEGYGGWSHVDAILPDGSCLGARSDVIKGIPAGVQIRPEDYETWKRRDVLTLDCTPEEETDWEYRLRRNIGLGYDKGDILGFITGHPMSEPGHWICSAVQLDVIETMGKVNLRGKITPQQCPPNMLYAMLLAIGAK